MNSSIPTEVPQTEVPQNVEHEIDMMLAGINEMLVNIRRNREEGAKIMAEADVIRESNVQKAKELDERIARWK